MKIELKNTDFKQLYKWLVENTDIVTPKIGDIIHKNLKPQYDKAFLKYKDEKQKFTVGEKVEFRTSTKVYHGTYGHKIENTNWIDGKIHKISRMANGKYRYVIKYEDDATDTDVDLSLINDNGETVFYTNPITEKNIRKII